MKSISAAEFNSEVLGSTDPVLVYFWSEFFGVCKIMALIIEEFEKGSVDTIKVVKLNFDFDASDLIIKLHIKALPTCMLYRAGKQLASFSGVKNKQSLANWIAEALS